MGYFNQPLIRESVSAVTATPSVEIGTMRTVNSREYTYVYNGGAEINQNYVAVITGVSGYTVNVTYATGAQVAAIPFGVAREATLPAANYGWVVTRGFCDVYNNGTLSVSTGDLLILGGNGQVKQVTGTMAVTQVVFAGRVGVAQQSTDTAGVICAYVRLG